MQASTLICGIIFVKLKILLQGLSVIDILGIGFSLGASCQGCENGPEKIYEFVKKNSQDFVEELNFWPIIKPKGCAYSSKLTYQEKLQNLINCFVPIQANLESLLNRQSKPIILGGDHSIAIATWSKIISYFKFEQNFGLIWIDAHLDAHTHQTTLTQNIHGMPLAALLGFGEPDLVNLYSNQPKINPKDLVIIGVRSYESSEHELLKKLGVKIYYIEDMQSTSLQQALQDSCEYFKAKTKKFGISIDLDGFDPKYAPGVGTPEANGLNPEGLISFFTSLDWQNYKDDLAALEIVEYNPKLDKNNKTLELINKIIRSYCGK